MSKQSDAVEQLELTDAPKSYHKITWHQAMKRCLRNDELHHNHFLVLVDETGEILKIVFFERGKQIDKRTQNERRALVELTYPLCAKDLARKVELAVTSLQNEIHYGKTDAH